MVASGKKWGDYIVQHQNDPINDAALSADYYDGERTFYQISDYLSQAEPWTTYANAAEVVYRDRYAIGSNYQLPGYWRFPDGIYFDAVRNNDATSRAGIVLIRDVPAVSDPDTNQWAYSFWYQDVSREVAYALRAHILAERAGNSRVAARVPLYVQMALKHMEEWRTQQFANPDPTQHFYTPFMFGLTGEALIDYYEWEVEQGRNPGSAIPDAIKACADYTWNAPVVDQPGDKMWIPNIDNSGYGGFRYGDRTWSHDGDGGNPDPAPDLNMLIAPIYAWLYKHFGEGKFLDQGDQIWKGGVMLTDNDWSGKLFNQNYRCSFAYVKWRQEGQARCP